VPGGKMNMTLELVLSPMIHDLIENKKKKK